MTESLTREASANEALRAANLRERASREQAQRRFGLARQAIEQYYTGASEDVLLKQPELEALRKKLLGTSLGLLQATPGRAGGLRRPGHAFRAGGGVYASGRDHGPGGPDRRSPGGVRAGTGDPRGAGHRPTRPPTARAAICPAAWRASAICWSGSLDARSKDSSDWNAASGCARRWRWAERTESDDRLAIARIHRETANGQGFAGRASEQLRSLEQARDVAERLLVDRPGDAAARTGISPIYQELAYALRSRDAWTFRCG